MIPERRETSYGYSHRYGDSGYVVLALHAPTELKTEDIAINTAKGLGGLLLCVTKVAKPDDLLPKKAIRDLTGDTRIVLRHDMNALPIGADFKIDESRMPPQQLDLMDDLLREARAQEEKGRLILVASIHGIGGEKRGIVIGAGLLMVGGKLVSARAAKKMGVELPPQLRDLPGGRRAFAGSVEKFREGIEKALENWGVDVVIPEANSEGKLFAAASSRNFLHALAGQRHGTVQLEIGMEAREALLKTPLILPIYLRLLKQSK